MGRKFVRISLGGMRDEAEINAATGEPTSGRCQAQIIQNIRASRLARSGFSCSMKIDKLGADFRGDPASALAGGPSNPRAECVLPRSLPWMWRSICHGSFSSQRRMSWTPFPPSALRDRMEVIELSRIYGRREGADRAQNYLVPRSRDKQRDFSPNQIEFPDEALHHIVRHYTREKPGVRNPRAQITSIFASRLESSRRQGSQARGHK